MSGKIVIEDSGSGYGRTRDWPAIPKDVDIRHPTTNSTSVVCDMCEIAWGGLTYDTDTDTFRHRLDCPPRMG